MVSAMQKPAERNRLMALNKSARSLQQLIDSVPNLVDYLHNDTIAPHFRARNRGAFVPPEVTNWRDEQRAWRDTAILFDQSHHMPELFLKGPDASKLLERLCINSFGNFGLDRAKQLIACTSRGYLIGDCVAYHLAPDSYELVSGMPLLNWVQYQAAAGEYDVTIERDAPSASNPKGRRVRYRFQLDGPQAGRIFDEVVEDTAPEIPFFRTARVKIRGCEVLVLRHGMAGHRGAELSGPWEQLETVREALLETGKKYGLVQGGAKAYVSTLYESGWMAYPLPAIYTDADLRGFRDWLPADGYEGNFQLGGSFVASNIEDYYVTPWHLGYEKILKLDHNFVGREALERMPASARRTKVTLVWNLEDLTRIFASQFGSGPRFKSLEFPVAHYGYPQFDEVRTVDGKLIGLSCHCGYSSNEGAMLSLAMLDTEQAQIGAEVVVTWGEPGGGSRKPHVEHHEQTNVRARVAPCPYAAAVREKKRETLNSR
jgi:vanillate/3-O-methylgallate O-demethylase